MTFATGVGSHPGDDARDYADAVRVVWGELAEGHLPYVPELPGRGAIGNLTGRALAMVTEIGADLQPAGWRLTTGSGVDHRRARSLLAQDLDAVEEQTQGYTGDVKVQVCGPWTLAATTEKPRGDKVLADHGARRDLAQALAAGLAEHLADVRRRLPRASRIVCQLDEPALPAVLRAQVPTASGFGRHRSVDIPEVSTAIGLLAEVIQGAGAEPWLHCCAPGLPYSVLSRAGVSGFVVDSGQLDAEATEEVAQLLEDGAWLTLGVLPTLPAAGDTWTAVR
ncbi:MAG: methionine synthase, partial [Nocardioides sp.]